MNNAPVVQLQNLSYAVGGRTIVDGISLDIYAGEVFCVLGMSGTGKTTLLRLICGLIRPISGTIRVFGEDITNMREADLNAVRARMGLVFQYGALFDSITVRENIGFRLYEHSNAKEDEVRRTVAEKLRLVGLSGIEEMYPAELSGGMQKRVGIARALVGDPQVLLYDEPTSGLDPITAAAIDEQIVRLRNELNMTEIVVSHDVASVLKMADRIAFLYQGHIRFVGTPQEIRAHDDPAVRQFLQGETDGPIQLT